MKKVVLSFVTPKLSSFMNPIVDSSFRKKKGNIVFRRKSAILDNGMVVRAIMRTRTLCYI